ncbi:MAG: hypothetical protein WHV66_09255 [Anaerolineales bacterium]
MKKNWWNVEAGLYGLAVLVAVLIRVLRLGAVPLSDGEAVWSLKALELSTGSLQTVGNFPGYVLWTGLLFYLFEASNWLARILPALIGALAALAPYFYRRYLGHFEAILLAFALALSPTLVANSRFIDGSGMALVCLLLAGGFWLSGYSVATGIAAGWALLSGPRVWLGVLIGVLVFIWEKAFQSYKSDAPGMALPENEFSWRKALLALALMLLFGGTLFFQTPAGLNGVTGGLVEFLTGWAGPLRVGMEFIWMAWLVYEPLAVFLGMWGMIRGLWKTRTTVDIILSRAVIAVLFVVTIYPAHQVLDLGFVVAPLWALGVRQAAYWIRRRVELEGWKELTPALGMSAAVFTLLVFSWMSLGRLINLQGLTDDQKRLVGASIVVAFAMIMLITVLVAWGWSWAQSGVGLLVSMMCLLLIYNFSALWNGAGLGRNPAAELWHSSAYPTDHDLLVQTVYDTAERARGMRTELDIYVVDIDSPSLQWALRKMNTVKIVKAISPEATPSLVITRDDLQPAFSVDYTGQDFVWKEVPAWDLLGVADWLRWMMFRYVPSGKEYLVVWVRSALMPGASAAGVP